MGPTSYKMDTRSGYKIAKKKTKQKNNKKREIMIPGEILVDLTVLNGLSVVFLSESLLWKYYILLEK